MRALIRSGGRTRQGPSLLSDKRTYKAAAGQTEFSITYEGDNVDVYVNGLRLAPDAYVATTGDSVSLVKPCSAGDIVSLCGGEVSIIPDAYSKPEVDEKIAGRAALLSTSTISGGVKTRLAGTTLFITTTGTDA